MFKILFWARNKPGQSAEQFRRYWLEVHASLARDKLSMHVAIGLLVVSVALTVVPHRQRPNPRNSR